MTRKIFLILILAFCSAPSHSLWSAGNRAVSSYELEAAYLIHFLEFVDWPSSAFRGSDSPYIIGILGDDPFGGQLERQVSGKLFNGRKVMVRQFGGFDAGDVEGFLACHILFVSGSEKNRLTAILRKLHKSPILTVSEIDKFPIFGGIIQFDQEGKKIRLNLNPQAAKAAHLRIRARLLQVCRIYRPE